MSDTFAGQRNVRVQLRLRTTDRFGAGVARMRVGVRGIVIIGTACQIWLSGCDTTSNRLSELFGGQNSSQSPSEAGDTATTGSITDPAPTGSIVAPAPETPAGAAPVLGNDPYDDLALGKQSFRQENYGIAERYFRRAVEQHPRDAEAWLGLAASYDRLRRFDLADRAYDQLIRIAGPTPDILNNRGYSYMLRGDYKRARETLLAAQAKDPANPYIKNNLDLLERSAVSRKAIR